MLKSVHPFVTFPYCLACILQLPGVGPSGLWLSLDLPSLQFIQGQVLVVPPLQSFPPGSLFLTFTPAPSVGPRLSHLRCCSHLLTGPLLPASPSLFPPRHPAGCTFHSALSSSQVYLKTFHVFLGRDPKLSIF